MFAVFEDVQKGIYKRSSLSATSAGEKKSKPGMHIDGPLEIKGTASTCVYSMKINDQEKEASLDRYWCCNEVLFVYTL